MERGPKAARSSKLEWQHFNSIGAIVFLLNYLWSNSVFATLYCAFVTCVAAILFLFLLVPGAGFVDCCKFVAVHGLLTLLFVGLSVLSNFSSIVHGATALFWTLRDGALSK